MMVLLFVCQVSVKAVVVFKAGTDRVVNGTITKDGISISGLGIYENYDFEEMPTSFGTSDMTVSSTVGNIVMIGFCYSPFDFYEGGATNSWQGDYGKDFSPHPKRISNFTNQIQVDASVGSFEEGVWRGASSSVHFNFNHTEYLEALYVYLEGDQLPVKKPYALSEYYYWIDEEEWVPEELYSSLTICFGYSDFVCNYSKTTEGYVGRTSVYKHDIIEGGSLPRFKSSYFGLDYDDLDDFEMKEKYDWIGFSDSFSDYHPTNISYLFQGVKCYSSVDFSNLDLSEVNDASYMFKNSNVVVKNLHCDEGDNLSNMFSGYINNSLDISSWNFSNNTIVTGMFANSSIQHLTVGPSINNARNDIFNGLGTYSNPCKLEIVGKVDLGQTPGNDVFSWKGGYFILPQIILPQKEAYVSVEKVRETYEPEYLKRKLNGSRNEIDFYYTFRYDTNRSMYAKTFSIDEEQGDVKKWVTDLNSLYENKGDDYWYYEDGDEYYNIKAVSLTIDPSFADYRPTSTRKWFFECMAEQIDGIEYLNTSEVTDMGWMFSCCDFTTLDMSHFDTSKVTDMRGMFESSHMQSLDLSNFNTSNVTNMYGMFWGCRLSNGTLDLSSFDTSKVLNMDSMFYVSRLSTIDVSNFDTSNVTNMSGMFGECWYLSSLDVSNFNTSNVTDMSCMFGYCETITTLDVSNFNTSNVMNMEGMFCGCGKLNSLDVSSFDTSNVIDMQGMFADCIITSLDVSHFNTSNVTNMASIFSGCRHLSSLDVSNFNTNELMEGENSGSFEMFSGCTSLQDLTVSATMDNIQENACTRVGSKNNPCVIHAVKDFDFDTDTSQSYFIWKNGFFVKGEDIYNYAVGDTIIFNNLKFVITNMDEEDSEVTLIKNPDAVGAINIPATITDESGMFNFNVTAIEEMAFFNCAEITTLSIPATVRSIGAAITSCCTILNEITVDEASPYFDSRDNCNAIINTETGELLAGCNKTTIPEGVTAIGREAMRGMFDLEGIKLPSTLTYIGNRAFYYCKKLTGHLNIPEGVTEVATYAFYSCKGLTAISLPSTITTMGSCAFRECTNVTSVTCRATTPPSIDSRMFGNFSTCTLTVPVGCVDTYKNAANWKKFYKIMEESVLSVADVQVLNGNRGNIAVSLNNGSNVYNGYQFNLTLPEGVDLTDSPRRDYDFTISNRYDGNPDISITPQDDGSYMVLMYSMNNTTITGSDGVIITLPVKVSSSLAADTYTGTITDIAFNNPDNTSAFLQDVTFNIIVPAFTLGDVNHDRSVNITDVMMTVNHVVGQNPAGFYVETADVNGDNVVNISDIMAIVNLVVSASTSNAPALNRESTMDAITLTPTKDGYAVSLKNNEPYTALQMDIQLSNNAPFNVRLSENRSDGHSVTCSDLGNGHHRIAIYSLNGHALKGSDGILFQLQTNKQDAPEIFDVQLTNNIFESVTLSNITMPTDITNIESASDDAPAYNIQGIRAPHHRGILIKDGKKQVRK